MEKEGNSPSWEKKSILSSSSELQCLLCHWTLSSHRTMCLAVAAQSLSRVCLFVTPRTAACQAALSFTVSQSLLKFMPIESVMLSNHVILCCPVSALGSFPMNQLFISGGQSVGVSASVLPMNTQSWFPLGLSGLISFVSKGLSRVFSNTTVQKHQFFSAQLSLWSNSNIHTQKLVKP